MIFRFLGLGLSPDWLEVSSGCPSFSFQIFSASFGGMSTPPGETVGGAADGWGVPMGAIGAPGAAVGGAATGWGAGGATRLLPANLEGFQ